MNAWSTLVSWDASEITKRRRERRNKVKENRVRWMQWHWLVKQAVHLYQWPEMTRRTSFKQLSEIHLLFTVTATIARETDFSMFYSSHTRPLTGQEYLSCGSCSFLLFSLHSTYSMALDKIQTFFIWWIFLQPICSLESEWVSEINSSLILWAALTFCSTLTSHSLWMCCWSWWTLFTCLNNLQVQEHARIVLVLSFFSNEFRSYRKCSLLFFLSLQPVKQWQECMHYLHKTRRKYQR